MSVEEATVLCMRHGTTAELFGLRVSQQPGGAVWRAQPEGHTVLREIRRCPLIGVMNQQPRLFPD